MFVQTETTLADILQNEGPLPWERATTILQHLVEALAEAHQENRVIGNLHPAQIFFDQEKKPLIGVLHGMEGWMPDESQRPLIFYQAPEQLRGEPATPQTDQFALAAIFFEMIGGQPPFDAEDEEWLRHLILREPPALLPDDVDAPPGVGSVLGRALAKEPTKRFEDILAFSWAIEAFDAPPLTADVIEPAERSANRRHWLVVGSGVAALIAGVIFFLFSPSGFTFFLTPMSSPTSTPNSAAAAIVISDTATPSPTPTRDPNVTLTPRTNIIAVASNVTATTPPTATPTPATTMSAIPTLVPTPTPTPIPMAEALRKLNLRRGPGVTHPIVTQMEKGEMLPILGQTADGAWLQVQSPKGVAWVTARLVEVQKEKASISVVSNPPTPPPPPITQIKPILTAPRDGAIVNDGDLPFSWKWPGPSLPKDYSFALRIWKEGSTQHDRAALAGVTTSLTLNLLDIMVIQQNGQGRYYWSIVVVDKASGRVIGVESDPRMFIMQSSHQPANGGGNNGGGNNGGGSGDSGGGGSSPTPTPSQPTQTPQPTRIPPPKATSIPTVSPD